MKCKWYYPTELSHTTELRGGTMSFLLIAQSPANQVSTAGGRERQNIIDKMHTWQLYSVTKSEDILTKCGFNLR